MEAASVTLIRGEKPFTAAYDGQMALDADEMQYEHRYGPCMDAGLAGQMFLVDDMRSEQRWPYYAQTWPPTACSARYRWHYRSKGTTTGAAQHLRQPAKGFRRHRC